MTSFRGELGGRPQRLDSTTRNTRGPVGNLTELADTDSVRFQSLPSPGAKDISELVHRIPVGLDHRTEPRLVLVVKTTSPAFAVVAHHNQGQASDTGELIENVLLGEIVGLVEDDDGVVVDDASETTANVVDGRVRRNMRIVEATQCLAEDGARRFAEARDVRPLEGGGVGGSREVVFREDGFSDSAGASDEDIVDAGAVPAGIESAREFLQLSMAVDELPRDVFVVEDARVRNHISR